MHRRLVSERAFQLHITALGAQGKGEDINKQIKDWEKES